MRLMGGETMRFRPETMYLCIYFQRQILYGIPDELREGTFGVVGS